MPTSGYELMAVSAKGWPKSRLAIKTAFSDYLIRFLLFLIG